MRFTSISTLLMSLIVVVIIAAIVYLFVLLIRALRKYLRSGEVRQENRAADPSTANLLALAKLYGVSPEELLHNAQSEDE